MASREELDRKLASLYRIYGISNPPPELETLMREGRFDEAHSLVDGRFEGIREVLTLQSEADSSTLYQPLVGRLSEQEYVLPPELIEVNPKVLADITSRKTTDHFTHGGLLLFDDDIGGTGKTEYTLFLATQARDNVCFVRANGNAIRESSRPGTILKQVYTELEARAIEEDVTYVVFFDEFEKIVNKHAKQHTAVREETTSTSTRKRDHSETRRETSQTLEVDSVGEELFSTLKDCISGGEQIKHVFTIAASNQSAYPETLLRRLQPVELFPLGIKEISMGRFHKVPDYGTYNESIHRILSVLQATHVRLNDGQRNPSIERIANEIQPILGRLREEHGSPYKEKAIIESHMPLALRNNAYLKSLMGYFGCELEEEQSDFKKMKILEFAGQMEIRRHDVSQKGILFNKTSPEVIVMRGLTPDAIAKLYKSGKDVFSDYETAKQFLGEALFPQLRSLREYKIS